MGGRYCPVFLMKIPVAIEAKERDRAVARV